MNTTEIYAVNPTVVFRRTQPHLVMAFDKTTGVMYEMNETASSIVTLLDGQRTYAEVLSLLAQEYEAEPESMSTDVDELLRRLIEVNVVLRT